jgi:allophanate hydrolase
MQYSLLYTNKCTKTVTSTAQNPRTLTQWQDAYRAGVEPADLLAALRNRVIRGDDPAVIRWVTGEELARRLDQLAEAASAHADRAALLQALPLFGVPFAVKDNIDIAGIETTAACPAFAYVPERSAEVVRRLEAAGAVWIAKTNLDQFATGLVGARSPYGRPASVFAAERISGGSSSGSAVLTARGDVAFALGTDTAGSGRVPAGFNDLVGLKPTPGRVSTAGVVPACRTLDCVSVFAHTVEDVAAVLSVIEGADPADAYSQFAPGPSTWASRLKVGVPRVPVFFGDAGYEAAWARAVEQLASLGHEVVQLDFEPLDEVAALLYDGPWVAERHAVVEALLNAQPDAIDATVRRVISRAVGMSATDAFRGLYRLQTLTPHAQAIWSRCDLLMVPTAPGHPRFTELDADPVGVNSRLGRYTNFVNLLGWCALALPAGRSAVGLPFGVTFIAPGNHDAALARFGLSWQAAQGGAQPAVASAPWPKSEPELAIAVVGAHLSGLPLNWQLTERGATLIEATHTAPRYRLFALPGTVPPKPGMVRDSTHGASIALEVWRMPQRAVGSFLALIPAPLGLGSIELADGRWVHGFVCEAEATAQASDITELGGWRAYLQAAAAALPVAPRS